MENSIKQFNLFYRFYSLPHFKYQENVNEYFLNIQKKKFFIVIAIFNENKEILYLKNLNRNNGWELVGGFVSFKPHESIVEMVNRLVKKEVGLDVDEILPITKLTNIFSYQHTTLRHQGIAFIAKTRGIPKFQKDYQGLFLSRIPHNLIFSNKKIAREAMNIFSNRNGSGYENEIDSFKKIKIKYILHNLVIGPMLRTFSYPVKSFVFKNIGQTKSVIDVSAGDDDLIVRIASKLKLLCCSNDISGLSLKRVQNKSRKIQNIFFTNQDATNLFFKTKFDLAICKNTLHHMHTISEKRKLLKSIARIAKRVIIIDIEDPLHSGFWAKFWHNYYLFIGDQGNSFMNEEEFKNIINNFFRSNKKRFGKIATLKGKYLAAVIDVN